MKIGDEVYVHGYVDEIRNDVVIIRNEGGYFGTLPSECYAYEEDTLGYGTMNEAEQTEPNSSEKPNNCEPKICDTCRYYNSNIPCGSTPSACKEADKFAEEFVDGLKKLKPKDEPQTEVETMSCAECKHRPIGAEICEEACHYEPQTDWHYDEQDATWYPYKHEDEPQYEMGMGTLKCDNCSEYGSFKCAKCDGEMYFKRLEVEDEPQTDEPTWEQVKEYCNKRCLDIVDSAMRKQWYKDELQKWETPPKFEHKGVTTTCVSVPAWAIEDEPQTEDEILREQCRAFMGIVEQMERSDDGKDGENM